MAVARAEHIDLENILSFIGRIRTYASALSMQRLANN
jgi:uncharacterized protein with HEPN domain